MVARRIRIGSSIVPATEWDGTDHTSNVTITNSGRTITYSGGGNNNISGRSTAGTTANQLVYIEHTCQAVSTNGAVGFSTSATTLSGGLPGEVSTATAFYVASNGTFRCQDSAHHTVAIIPSWTAADTVDLAYNSQTGKLWARKNGGSWNASQGGGQDPEAGTGGATVPFTGGVYKTIFWFDGSNGDGFVTSFSSADWARYSSLPSYSQLAA